MPSTYPTGISQTNGSSLRGSMLLHPCGGSPLPPRPPRIKIVPLTRHRSAHTSSFRSHVQVHLGEPAVALGDDPELVVGDRLDLRAVERPAAGEGQLAGGARLAGAVDPHAGEPGVARLVQPQHLPEPV